ncbi:hypothetical protein PROFUN_13030 [Planoprotostelium fungivorum]|uniref:N-acetyltransferase domain-containing protein n=1 Tax=Planoprotostelium fungivorum TaxID=1890364 RepID=A0A2P6N5M0_9EUKA|nr:hypothetical protein PROFUN_13030 [Planoprotostelium fungivorum]
MSVSIRSIESQSTMDIRHRVLWPDQPIEYVILPEDEKGFHFGAFLEISCDPVAVISLFREGLPRGESSHEGSDETNTVRFRKFACAREHQGHGIGSQLLQHVFQVARNDLAAQTIWCDARRQTQEWYERRGMKQFGDPFWKGGVEYIRVLLSMNRAVYKLMYLLLSRILRRFASQNTETFRLRLPNGQQRRYISFTVMETPEVEVALPALSIRPNLEVEEKPSAIIDELKSFGMKKMKAVPKTEKLNLLVRPQTLFPGNTMCFHVTQPKEFLALGQSMQKNRVEIPPISIWGSKGGEKLSIFNYESVKNQKQKLNIAVVPSEVPRSNKPYRVGTMAKVVKVTRQRYKVWLKGDRRFKIKKEPRLDMLGNYQATVKYFDDKVITNEAEKEETRRREDELITNIEKSLIEIGKSEHPYESKAVARATDNSRDNKQWSMWISQSLVPPNRYHGESAMHRLKLMRELLEMETCVDRLKVMEQYLKPYVTEARLNKAQREWAAKNSTKNRNAIFAIPVTAPVPLLKEMKAPLPQDSFAQFVKSRRGKKNRE